MHAALGRPHARHIAGLPKFGSRSPRWTPLVIGMVFALDLFLLAAAAAHLIANRFQLRDHSWAVFDSGPLWSGRLDGSMAETFGDLQLACVTLVLLGRSLLSANHQVYAAWGFVLLMLTLEDHFRLHQLAELSLSSYLQGSRGDVTAMEVGTVLGVTVFGLLVGGWLVVAHARSRESARRGSRWLWVAVACYGFFAVGVDLLSNLVHSGPDESLYLLVTYVETAGELLSMSFMLAVALRFTLVRSLARESPL